MLFGFWQLKTTVLALLLASCLGHELLRTCQRDYCSERSIKRQNFETDNLRKSYGVDGRRVDTVREIENLENMSRGLRENRLDQISSECNREVHRTLADNRREIVRHEPSRREPYRNLNNLDNRRVMAGEDDFNNRAEETPKMQHSAKLVLERKQETNVDRFRTPKSRLNERENRQERNELRDENQESHRFNDRLSRRHREVFQSSEESHAERIIRDVDRQSRRSSDRIIESERNLLQRRERNQEERENREYRRSDEHITDRNPEAVQRRHQINEESSIINEVLTRNQHENNRDVARRETENLETRGFDERTSERALEIRFENLRRERQNDGNMDKSRRLSLSEGDLLDRYDSRLDERERSNHRSIEQLSERTQESIQRRDRSLQERDTRLEEVRTSSSRHDLTENLTEQRENLRRLNKREPLDEDDHSMEQLSERRHEIAMQRREINRHERSDNREFGRSNSRLSEQQETTRRLNEHENGRYNKHLSNVEDRNERQHDLKNFTENRESRKPNQRIIEREERNAQRRIPYEMERERNAERNVRDNENRRVTSRQDNSEQRYDINKRLTEREFTQRSVENTRKVENNSRQPAITQKEAYSSRVENRFDDLSEREHILNRNRDSQRYIERRTESDEENFEIRNENVNHMGSSARSEPRNIHRLTDENRNSRRSDERRTENVLLNPFSRRSSFKNERESVEQRYLGGSEFTPRREELLKLDERDNERNIKRASDRSSTEIQGSRVRTFENVDNIRERDNHNLDERNLQYETNRDLETRRSNERRDIIESTRNNHQMVLRKGEATKLQPRQDENKREQREDRGNHRFETLSNRNVENRRDFQLIADEYKETPTDSPKSSNIAYVQGIILGFVIMKTLNGKNNIKCQISQKFQEASAVLGF